MSKNHDELRTFLSTLSFSFSVLAFSETWLTDDVFSLFPLPNYVSFHSCRKNKRGGGVSLYVLNSFDAGTRDDLSAELDTTNTESIFIEIPSCQQFNGKSILIGCIYRPPDSDHNTFIDALQSTLELISKESKLCFLLGDYNINLLKCDLSQTVDFLNAIHSFNFFPLITKPSRITSSSATLIDNILFNSYNFEVTSGLLMCDVSDHFPVFQFIQSSQLMSSYPKNGPNTYRKFSRNNIDHFKSAIGNIIWDEIFVSQDVNSAYSLFLKFF